MGKEVVGRYFYCHKCQGTFHPERQSCPNCDDPRDAELARLSALVAKLAAVARAGRRYADAEAKDRWYRLQGLDVAEQMLTPEERKAAGLEDA